MDHRNGNILIVGTMGIATNYYSYEMIALDQNLNYIDGPY